MKSTIAKATMSVVLAAKLPVHFRIDGCQRVPPPISTHFEEEREKHWRQVETRGRSNPELEHRRGRYPAPL